MTVKQEPSQRRIASVLFICTGNICRSPTAEGVLRHLAAERSLELRIESAGVGDWHISDPPDERALRHAKSRGYDLSAQRARQVRAQDFGEFDMILAMDRGHLEALRRMAPPHHHAKIRLFVQDFDVPDPYYGGAEGFEKVLDLVEERCRALLNELKPTS
jgi:protein-tyrosine phosphatase